MDELDDRPDDDDELVIYRFHSINYFLLLFFAFLSSCDTLESGIFDFLLL